MFLYKTVLLFVLRDEGLRCAQAQSLAERAGEYLAGRRRSRVRTPGDMPVRTDQQGTAIIYLAQPRPLTENIVIFAAVTDREDR